jgi:signal transduction histidine kinase
MFSVDLLINILGIISFLTIILLVLTLFFKIERMKTVQTTLNKVKKQLDEMDEQAKLIMRTDLELNKTQEELDKKVAGLYALQKLSRSIASTLEESQIFNMVDPTCLAELGFEKGCAFLWNESQKRFLPQINIGFLPEEIEAIKTLVEIHKDKFLSLIKAEKTFSSLSGLDPAFKEKIKGAGKARAFVISPILPKEGEGGFLLVGTENPDFFINEGDEELITILANQLGQTIENARLFEQTWRSQQDLEKKVEERTHELSRVLEEVKTISKRKTDFISSVSHELRTPLTSIKGYAAILLAEKLGKLPSEIKERLEKINRHSDELVHLVNDLLDIARIESGRMLMKKEPQELKQIIDAVEDLLGVQLKQKHIRFEADVAVEAQKILADRSQLERVFINLIGNACKFTPEKGKIRVGAHKRDDMIQVDIADTGCGIPDEALGAIFEEFYRVDNPINQEVKGTGRPCAGQAHCGGARRKDLGEE